MKCKAPTREGGSWRGQKIEVADDLSCELSPEALAEMRAHSFREWREEDEIASDKGDAADPENMSRRELLGFLKGRNAGNITLMTTDELRALARKAHAGEDIGLQPLRYVAPEGADEPAQEAVETGEAASAVEEPAPADGAE